MGEWQPIDETAPKDGTPVDLWVVFPNSGYRWADAKWFPNGGYRWADAKWFPNGGYRWADAKWLDAGKHICSGPADWCSREGFPLHSFTEKPVATHWMPTPPAPEVQSPGTIPADALQDLIERLKTASGPVVGLHDLYDFLTPARKLGWPTEIMSLFKYALRGDLNSAVALAERLWPNEGCAFNLVRDYGGLYRVHLNVDAGERVMGPGWNISADASTLPLALCLAILRALAAQAAHGEAPDA